MKNPFAEGPAYVTIEEYNCLRDGKDKEALQYTEEYDKAALYPDNETFQEISTDWSEPTLNSFDIIGNSMDYTSKLMLNEAGLPQTVQAIENGKYYEVSGFYQNQM